MLYDFVRRHDIDILLVQEVEDNSAWACGVMQ
jgi:hypothetical protein